MILEQKRNKYREWAIRNCSELHLELIHIEIKTSANIKFIHISNEIVKIINLEKKITIQSCGKKKKIAACTRKQKMELNKNCVDMPFLSSDITVFAMQHVFSQVNPGLPTSYKNHA